MTLESGHNRVRMPSAEVEAFEDGSDLVAGAFDLEPSGPQHSIRKKMWPWHRPRKHYCRIKLWCHHIRLLIKQLGRASASGRRPLRYLSLPGDELLDVRTIHDVCEQESVLLEILGFNKALEEPRRSEADISWSEVRNLKFVCEESSRVEMLSIEDVARTDSLAHRRVREHAPFDVINLDLCGSVAKAPPKTLGSTLEALNRLVHTQKELRAEPWLLFLATRIGIDTVDPDTAKRLFLRITNNAQNVKFAHRFNELFPFGVEGISNHIENHASLDPEKAISALSAGLAKWLLGVCTSEMEGWEVELVGSLGYQVHEYPKDMMSFAFRISRATPDTVDPTGITEGTLGRSTLSEVEQAIALLEPLSKTIDVDALLASDVEIRERTVRQTRELLATARHDEDELMAWLENLGDAP